MSKKKKEQKRNKEKMLIINQNWKLPLTEHELLGNKRFMYWFDINDYEFKEYDELNGEKDELIKLFQYDSEDYKELVKLVNNKDVTEYFNKVRNEEEGRYRYRVFIDNNWLYDDENYRHYLLVADLFIKWCEDNGIKYQFIPLSPPKNYLYSSSKTINDFEFEIPEEDYLHDM